MFLNRLLKTCFFVAFLFFLFPSFAYAYLDPGTGSYILQLLIAALVGGMVAIRLSWNKIKSFFKNLSSGEEKQEKPAD